MSSFFDHCVARVIIRGTPGKSGGYYWIMETVFHDGSRELTSRNKWHEAIREAVGRIDSEKQQYTRLFRQDTIVHTFPLAKGGMLDA